MEILNKLIYGAAAGIFLSLAGCYTDFIPELEATPVVCITSLVRVGEPFEIEVTRTWRYDEGGSGRPEIGLADTRVEIWIDNELVEIAKAGEAVGTYMSTVVPKQGQRLRVVANNEKYGVAEAEIEIPLAVKIEEVSLHPIPGRCIITDESIHLSYKINTGITFKDSAGIKNYYKVDAFDSRPNSAFWLYGISYTDPLFREHMTSMEQIISPDEYAEVFSDRQIDGRRYTIGVTINNLDYTWYEGYPIVQPNDTAFMLVFESVTESYYNYLIADWQSNYGILGSLSDIGLSDALTGYSNVSTGAGIIGAIAADTVVVRAKDIFPDFFESMPNRQALRNVITK